jgi:hypothetical protein
VPWYACPDFSATPLLLPPGIGTQPFAGMARANNLHVVELSETANLTLA